jgi:hypothetical protein
MAQLLTEKGAVKLTCQPVEKTDIYSGYPTVLLLMKYVP